MNRAQRRAAAKGRGATPVKVPRLHKMVMMSDALPQESAESVMTTKIRLLAGIAALKNGTFGYDQMCQFNDFVQLGLMFCDRFPPPQEVRDAVYKVASALILIMERQTKRGIYAATGDELRALSEWVEEIADYIGQFPAMALDGLRNDIALEELQRRARLAKKG